MQRAIIGKLFTKIHVKINKNTKNGLLQVRTTFQNTKNRAGQGHRTQKNTDLSLSWSFGIFKVHII
jgi:hypothetical protein